MTSLHFTEIFLTVLSPLTLQLPYDHLMISWSLYNFRWTKISHKEAKPQPLIDRLISRSTILVPQDLINATEISYCIIFHHEVTVNNIVGNLSALILDLSLACVTGSFLRFYKNAIFWELESFPYNRITPLVPDIVSDNKTKITTDLKNDIPDVSAPSIF